MALLLTAHLPICPFFVWPQLAQDALQLSFVQSGNDPLFLLHCSAATTLTTADFGKTFFIDADASTGFDISLPEAVAGNEITFVIYNQSNVTHRIVTTGSAEYFFGAVTVIGDTISGTSTQRVTRNAARVDSANHNAYELAASAATVGGLVGDVISMKCFDGSGWSVRSTHGTLAGVVASVDVITGQ